MRVAVLLSFILLTTVASAQYARVDRPFRLEAVAFFPNYRRASFGNDLGVAASLGYAFARKGNLDLLGSLRGQVHIASLGKGGDSGPFDGLEEDNLAISSVFMNASYAPTKCRFFGGVRIGVGQANVDGGDGYTGLLFAPWRPATASQTRYTSLCATSTPVPTPCAARR